MTASPAEPPLQLLVTHKRALQNGSRDQKRGQASIPELIKHSWRNCFDQIRDRVRTARL
jgi:hypothetical protein